MRTGWGLWLMERHQDLTLPRQFSAVAVRPADRLVGERMMGVSYHFMGDQSSARRHLERVIAEDLTDDSGSRIIRFQVLQRPAAQAFLARILWLQGFPEQAMQTARRVVEHALAADHANSLCHALALAACPVALRVGNLDLAEHYIGLLREHSTSHALALWQAWGRCLQGVLLSQRRDFVTATQLLREGFEELGGLNAGFRVRIFLGARAAALGRSGKIDEGLATIEAVVEDSQRSNEHWAMTELLRIKGDLLLRQGAEGSATAAEAHFREALGWARTQGALSWELRAAISLGRLLRELGRPADAAAILRPVYDRFSEGFDTADLKSARALLDELRQ
jgi:predicted ATPase